MTGAARPTRCRSSLIRVLALASLLIPLGLPIAHGKAGAQPARQVRDRDARVVVEVVDVRAGPAKAYLSKGRLYRHERVILRGDHGQAWVEVVTGQVRGWVPLSAFRIVTRQSPAKGPVEPGRDKRLRDYHYNKNGRRITRGQATGSGEGTRSRVGRAVVSTERHRGAFVLGIAFGLGQITRDFRSNADATSLLHRINAGPNGLASRLSARWQAAPWLELGGAFADVRFASTPVDFGPDAGGRVQLSVEAQAAHLGALVHRPVSALDIGLYAGLTLHRQHYRETRPVLLFLSTRSLSTEGGVSLAYDHRMMSTRLLVGIGVPFKTAQSPESSGSADGLNYRVVPEFSWCVSRRFGLSLSAELLQRKTDYRGESTHQETVSNPASPQNYSQAKEKDTLWMVCIGIQTQID